MSTLNLNVVRSEALFASALPSSCEPTAVARMRWARRVVAEVFAAPAARTPAHHHHRLHAAA